MGKLGLLERRGDVEFWGLSVVLHEVVGVAHQGEDFVVGHVGIQGDAYPVLLVAVIGFGDCHVALFEFGDALRLALDGDGAEIVDVEVAIHVPVYIENEYGEFAF